MSIAIAVAVFPVIFVGELPDKTMFAALVLASRGRPLAVWLGPRPASPSTSRSPPPSASRSSDSSQPRRRGARRGDVPRRGDLRVPRGDHDETALVAHEAATHRRVATTAFAVIFVAEWGDLTQILTANLAAHYESALSVAVGATAALWTVAALAVVGGQGLLRYVPVAVVRRVTGVVLLVLAAIAAWSAIPHELWEGHASGVACAGRLLRATPRMAPIGLEELVQELDRDRTVADRRRDPLDRAVAHVARGEDAGQARLEQEGIAVEGPRAGGQVGPGEDEALLVALDRGRQPLGVRVRADHEEERVGGDGLVAAVAAGAENQLLEPGVAAAAHDLGAEPHGEVRRRLDLADEVVRHAGVE